MLPKSYVQFLDSNSTQKILIRQKLTPYVFGRVILEIVWAIRSTLSLKKRK